MSITEYNNDLNSNVLNPLDFDIFNTENPNTEGILSILQVLERNMTGDIVEL
jgi:hypothetical protein